MADEYLTAALYGMKRFNEGMSKKVKELMGMEKLINLLNEFETPRSGIVFKSYDDYDGTFYGVDCDGETEIAWSDSYICGKRFGFINRLVRKNKIKAMDIAVKFQDEIDQFMHPYMTYDNYVNMFIMLLSIQERPIDFLISVLK